MVGIITYREIESFIDDDDTRKIVYDNIEGIIRKLCTYDRASLIACVYTKENGVEIIKKNLELFFKKGEYDISTTYSKILVELSDIPEISEEEILEACSKHLVEMLDRETAVDNETNVLLNWIYDSMEDAKLSSEKRSELQADIDKAIMDNFDGILDKTNYDKETIKILKLFPCTYGKFESNRNMFIENSSKLIHMTKIYDLNYEKEKEQEEEQKEEEYTNTENQTEDRKENDIKVDNIVEENNTDEIIDDEVNSSLAERFVKEVQSEIDTIEEYNELIKQTEENETNAEEILDALIKSNLYETNQIIDKVVNKEKTAVSEDTIAWNKKSVANATEMKDADDTKVFVKFDFGESSENKDKVQVIQENNIENSNIEKNNEEAVNEGVSSIEETQSYSFSRSVKEDNALVIGNEPMTGFGKVLRAMKGFFRKIKKVLAKYKTDRIGE